MRKQIMQVFACLGLFIALGVTSAAAQANTVVADVPFNFTVQDRQLLAGEYRIEQIAPATLVIRGAGGEAHTMVMTIAVRSLDPSEGKLVFNRYGSRYFLKQVWAAGELQGRELIKSKAEKELAKSQTKSEVALLARPSASR